jgi:uncharacterized membrane-anchored protein
MRGNFSAQAQQKTARPQGTRISGAVRCGRRTKDLVRRLQRGQIAVIDHVDLDSVGAQALVDAGVAAVVNLSPSISGRYPNRGPSVLLQNGVPLYDAPEPDLMDEIDEGTPLEIVNGALKQFGAKLAQAELQTPAIVTRKLAESRKNLDSELQIFAQNTLDYASRELSQLLAPVQPPPARVSLRGRHALIVVRGEGYRKDLDIIRSYLHEKRPVLIAVDGGADALLDLGLKPDVIIGDMDSVSDAALKSGAQIIVHTYADGRESPALKRVEALGVEHDTFSVPGTSEDAAMLFAFEHGAELIVAVGTHSNLYDFLDKGRSGMASTLLVRMRIGSRLVDARGVSKLYTPGKQGWAIGLVLVAGVLLLAVVVQSSEPLQDWFGMLGNGLRLKLLEWRFLGRG